MKRLEGYGVVLHPMDDSHLKKVLEWRNKDHVRQHFEYQSLITWEQHLEWWSSLNKKQNYYWIIETHHVGIGVVHAKGILWNSMSAEMGIFIGDSAYLRTPFPIAAIILMMDFMWEIGMKEFVSKVKASSRSNIDLNLALGYEILMVEKKADFLRMRLNDRMKYEEKVKKIRRGLESLE